MITYSRGLKRKYNFGDVVFVLRKGKHCYEIVKCTVNSVTAVKGNDTIIDWNYTLIIISDTTLDNDKVIIGIPQEDIFSSYRSCKKYILEHFDDFFLRI